MGMGRIKKVRICVFSKNMWEINSDCKNWAAEIGAAYQPDVVIFLAKSGFLFAKPLAEYFGCEMADIAVSRPSNGGKDKIRKYIPKIPRFILYFALKSKFIYGYHNKNNEREVRITKRFEDLDFSKYQRILLVDDSIDTGWSIQRVLELLRKKAAHCEIKIAGYCVIGMSEERVKTDFFRYKDTIVVTATSRYSSEYQSFLKEYESWNGEHENQAFVEKWAGEMSGEENVSFDYRRRNQGSFL